MSHDLQSPLQRVSSFARLLGQELGALPEGRAHHYLARIQANADEMTQLIQGLLALAHVSEVDVIRGLATAWPLLRGQIELGARAELDAAVDGSARLQSCNVGSGVGSKQGYGDVRARYAFALGEWWPALRPALADGDVTGWLTFGWFAVNPRAVAGSTGEMTAAYYARPENSGAALFRYVAHLAMPLRRYFSCSGRSVVRPPTA